jgi:hypothetical protein
LLRSQWHKIRACAWHTYGDGFKGNSVLPNETQLDYAARIGLESDQFSSNTSGFNGFINCQEKMLLSSDLLYNESGNIVPSISGRLRSDLKGRYVDEQLAAVGYKDIVSYNVARGKFSFECDANFQSCVLLGND